MPSTNLSTNGAMMGAPNLPGSKLAPGIWSVNDVSYWKNGATVGLQWPTLSDPLWANVTFLCDMDAHPGVYPFKELSGNFLKQNLDPQRCFMDDAKSRFGFCSLNVNGGGNYLHFAGQPVGINFGTGNYVVEGWFYVQAASAANMDLIDIRAGEPYMAPLIFVDPSQHLTFWLNGVARIVDSGLFPVNQWVYVALARDTSNTRMYINTNQVGSTFADANNYLVGNLFYGNSSGGSHAVSGWVGPQRITKGNSRGMNGATITVPTSPFPTYGP